MSAIRYLEALAASGPLLFSLVCGIYLRIWICAPTINLPRYPLLQQIGQPIIVWRDNFKIIVVEDNIQLVHAYSLRVMRKLRINRFYVVF